MMAFKLILVLAFLAVGVRAEEVSKADAEKWMEHLTPLPREIKLPAKVTLKRSDVTVIADRQASQIIDQAALELNELLADSAKGSGKGTFKITLQVGGSEADALKRLKNADQAYCIVPEKDNQGLRLVALSDRGLYHASKTLQQLLRARITEKSVEMPLVTVKDWPEMETRGLWGGDSYRNLPWLAERKYNYQENISRKSVDQTTKRGHARVKSGTEQLLTVGPRMGIQHAPVVLHLEQLEGTGLFTAYPELRGKDGGKPGVICYSQPSFVGVLADWITELGSQTNVDMVDVWFTENLSGKGGCKCEKCSKKNWVLEEARTTIAAWKEAQKRRPGLKLRVLTSEATDADNEALFAEIPREVGIWYYHSLLTYTAHKVPMIDGPVLDLAKQKRWVGVCPALVAHVGVFQPFTSADFIHYRISEFTQKGLNGMLGYAVPRTLMNRFHVEAAAEWMWNPKGRTPHEFTRTWAIREKVRNPETFLEWHTLMSPVEWLIYGSEWPAAEKRTAQPSVAQLLAQANLPELGVFRANGKFGSPWGEFKNPSQLKNAAASAAKGVKLARALELPEFIHESLVIQGYADSLCALWELKQLVTDKGIASAKRAAAKEQFIKYERALEQSRSGLRAWDRAVSTSSRGGHVGRTVEILESMSEQMQETAAKLNVPL